MSKFLPYRTLTAAQKRQILRVVTAMLDEPSAHVEWRQEPSVVMSTTYDLSDYMTFVHSVIISAENKPVTLTRQRRKKR